MSATCWQPPLPAVARLGFDRGWHFLAPTFLNFKMPAVLIDHRLIDDADLNLEPFANHHPDTPWRTANALLRLSGQTISLWQRQPEQIDHHDRPADRSERPPRPRSAHPARR